MDTKTYRILVASPKLRILYTLGKDDWNFIKNVDEFNILATGGRGRSDFAGRLETFATKHPELSKRIKREELPVPKPRILGFEPTVLFIDDPVAERLW